MAAVDISTRNSAALTQCRTRSALSKRASRGAWLRLASDGLVVAAIRLPDPCVHVVAALLPVAGRRLAVRDPDAVEPLARLVAVHGCHVEAHGPAVLGRHRLALH